MVVGPRLVALAIGIFIVGVLVFPLADSSVAPSIVLAQDQAPGAGSYLRARIASDLRAEPSDGATLRERMLPGQRLEVIDEPKNVDGQIWIFVRMNTQVGWTLYVADAFHLLPWTATPTRPTSTPTATLPAQLEGCWVRSVYSPNVRPAINVYANREPTGSAVVGLLYADEYALIVEVDINPRNRLGVRTSDVRGFVDQRDVVVLSAGAITATPTFTPNPNATATLTRTPVPTSTATTTPAPTKTKAPTKTPVPTKTPTPTRTSTSTPPPTKTATPTRTKAPTKTRTPKSTPTPPLQQ